MDHKEGTSSLIGVGIAVLANTLISAGLNHPNETTPLIVAPNKVPPPYSRSLSEPFEAPPPAASITVAIEAPPPGPRRTASHASNRSRSRSRSGSHPRSSSGSKGSKRPRTDKGFIRSPLWLFGFLLINLGEIGNFLAYGFAPTSLVAPLGMTALVANVFLAPAIVREPFRRKDLIGIGISLLGGATVVYASRSSDKKITPRELLRALHKPLFLAYSIASVVLMGALTWLSQTRYGDRFVLVDLTLCALAGAFTVLSTKALSSFLNSLGLDMFKQIVTYPLLLVLVSTALVQVNFINKSLQRFESRVVIPCQYMTFALASVLASAILYGDFDGMSGQSLLNFGFGCLVSAGGVYLLTRDGSNDEDKDKLDQRPSPGAAKNLNAAPTGETSSSSALPTVSLDLVRGSQGPSDHDAANHRASSSISVSPTTRIILPNHPRRSPIVPDPRNTPPSSALSVVPVSQESLVPGEATSSSARPGLAVKRTRTLSIGKYRFATGGYLLVGSSATLVYGLTVRAVDLVFAADAWNRLRPTLRFFDLVFLRRRTGSLVAQSRRDKGDLRAITRIPSEVWEEIRYQLVQEEIGISQDTLLASVLCGHSDCEMRPFSNHEYTRPTVASSGCADCWSNLDNWVLENLSFWHPLRIAQLTTAVKAFGLALPFLRPLAMEPEERMSDGALALLAAPSTFGDDADAAPLAGVRGGGYGYADECTIVNVSFDGLPLDIDSRFRRIVELFNLEIVDSSVGTI
ncbi:hypothetical protein JCM3766R1_000604 [Sporobolomyces carnicolor]